MDAAHAAASHAQKTWVALGLAALVVLVLLAVARMPPSERFAGRQNQDTDAALQNPGGDAAPYAPCAAAPVPASPDGDFYSLEAGGARPGSDLVDTYGAAPGGHRSERKQGHYRVPYTPDHEPLVGATESPYAPSKIAHLLR